MTGNLLLKLSGQGSVYIRSYECLDEDSDYESALVDSQKADKSSPTHGETLDIIEQQTVIVDDDAHQQISEVGGQSNLSTNLSVDVAYDITISDEMDAIVNPEHGNDSLPLETQGQEILKLNSISILFFKIAPEHSIS